MNAVVEQQLKPIAYWPNGCWEADLDDAKMFDQFELFGSTKHLILEVDVLCSDDEITEIIQEANQPIADEGESDKSHAGPMNVVNTPEEPI